jgi:MFS transporter, PAT family, beta-lactamase induction signal transducer AmpG
MAGEERPATWQSLRAAVRSWRLASVVLLMFSSGLPLGLVWIAIPTWMKQEGADIRVVGLLALTQAPWTFKVLWSPLVDRYALPFLGRKRGWILASQMSLLGLGLALSAVARHPNAAVVAVLALGVAFASATQDIAIDAYRVEVLRRDEYGVATGAGFAAYRAAMLLAGGSAITFAAFASWSATQLALAVVYLPLMLVTILAPEAEAPVVPPRTLREAVWGPFVEFLGRHRAVEILAFVALYKFSENLAQALIRPFLVQVGFAPEDVGIGTAVVGMVAMVAGTFLGSLWSQSLGLGRALWAFGILQMTAHVGYAAVAVVGVNRPLMYAAQVLETGTSGMAAGAFGILLLRLTQKRFSAAQYALLSSLLSLSRVVTGPIAGVLADSLGWASFFLLATLAGIPGLLMLRRFVPWSVREPDFESRAAADVGPPPSNRAVLWRGAAVGLIGGALGLCLMGLLGGVKDYRAGLEFNLASHLLRLVTPSTLVDWVTALGLATLAGGAGLAAAAVGASRRLSPTE